MRFSLLLCIVFAAAAACNKGPLAGAKEETKEEGNGSETKTGTLAVGEEAEAEAVTASTSLLEVADGFVPSSMKTGDVAVTDEPETQLTLLDGPPKFCEANGSHEMCMGCGPSGTKPEAECAAFFGPGGEGYTAGEQLGGGGDQGGNQGGGQEGGGGEEGPCFKDANANKKHDKGETVGFLECQPILTRIFLKVAADSMKQVAKIIKGSAQKVKGATASQGTVTIADSDEFSAIDYKIEPKHLEFLFKDKAGKAALKATFQNKDDVKVYTVDDVGLGLTPDGADMTFLKHVDVTFTNAKKWDTSIKLQAAKCNDKDPQAPQAIVISMNRNETLWEGKSNLWMPRWPKGGCSDPITATSGISIDTDITGEKQFTTGGTYLVPLTVDSLDFESIKTYPITAMCENFPKADYPSLCHEGGTVLDNQILPSSHVFCSKADLTYSYGGPCTGSEFPNVAAGTFGSHPWVSPKELSELTVTVPDSL